MIPTAPIEEDYPEAAPRDFVPGEQTRRLREAIGDELFDWLDKIGRERCSSYHCSTK